MPYLLKINFIYINTSDDYDTLKPLLLPALHKVTDFAIGKGLIQARAVWK